MLPARTGADSLKVLPRESARNMIRASLLMLVLLATAFCAQNWDLWHRFADHFTLLPVLVLAVVIAFAAAVYIKTREIAQLQDAIHALSPQHPAFATELQTGQVEHSKAAPVDTPAPTGDIRNTIGVLCRELNNSLKTMSAAGAVLAGAPDMPHRYEPSVDALVLQTCRAGNILQDLELLSAEATCSPVNVEELINRAIAVRWRFLRSSNIFATLQTVDPIPNVFGHSVQLSHVFLTLLVYAENRCLSRKDVSRRIDIHLKAADGFICCDIRDNGPVADCDRLSLRPNNNLDFLFSEAILTAHAGKIEISRTSEQGGLVRLLLPIARSN